MTSIIKKESVKYGNTAYMVLKMSQKDFKDMNRYISTRIAQHSVAIPKSDEDIKFLSCVYPLNPCLQSITSTLFNVLTDFFGTDIMGESSENMMLGIEIH
jgi:hypothetical protein